MPRFSSQTLSAARSSSFVRARVPGAGRDGSFRVAGFSGLFALRLTLRGLPRRSRAWFGLERESGDETSVAALGFTVQISGGNGFDSVANGANGGGLSAVVADRMTCKFGRRQRLDIQRKTSWCASPPGDIHFAIER